MAAARAYAGGSIEQNMSLYFFSCLGDKFVGIGPGSCKKRTCANQLPGK